MFITLVRTQAGEAELGLAGRVRGHTGVVTADVTFKAGLVHAADDGLTAVIGTSTAPMLLDFDLKFDPNDLGFDGIHIEARVVPLAMPPTADIRVEVGVVGPDGKVRQTALDPQHLGPDALQLVTALLQHRLDAVAADPGTPAELAALARHLLPVAGLGGGLPPFPLDRVGEGPLLREWLSELLDVTMPDGKPAINAWLGHVGGLFGAAPPTGTGTEADPWAIGLAALGTGGVELTFATRTVNGTRQLLIGARLNLDAPRSAPRPRQRCSRCR